jgi:hypothetical protein
LTIWKKAISAATSAALLASLLATAVAPAAFASITQTSAGNVAQGTTSANTATFLFTEKSKAALDVGVSGWMYVTILDHAGGNTVSWAGTPVVSAPDSLGVSVSISGAPIGNILGIRITGHDNDNIETIAISGLKVKASSAAAPGDLQATLSDSATGSIWQAFYSAATNASGKLVGAVGVGSSGFSIALDTNSPCSFTATATVGNPLVIAGSNPENITSASIAALSSGIQAVTVVSPVTTVNHLANDVVTQATGTCTGLSSTLAMGAPATVVEAVDYYGVSNPTVYPGESNADAADLVANEPSYGFLAKGTTLTFTIATGGVVFSGLPSLSGLAGSAVLSSDRKSVVVTITTASLVDFTSGTTLGNIHYDVAASVPGGTYVEVGLALSGGLLVVGSPATNAVVFRGINASAPTPTVYIGENSQATGLVTLTEQAAGFFQSGTGNNNVIEVCDTGVHYDFTFAPWAKVTAGDLKLREGSVVSPDNIVEGTQSGDCYTWTVWTGSTAASTIVIGNSTFASGPIVNVHTDQAPGIVALNVYSGNDSVYTSGRIATVGFAVAAYRNQVAVTALSQPLIPAGAKTKAGAIQVAETANGQLKRWEHICVEVLPRVSNELFQDTYLQALTTADLPIVTATGGLVVGPVSMSDYDCDSFGRQVGVTALYVGTHAVSFHFDILQQSTSGTGKAVIDNLNLITTADAPNGPVLFNVYGFGGEPTHLEFQATVSNAKIGVAPKLSVGAVSALGLNPTSGYTASTPKTQALGKYVTWKFTGGTALAGQRVNVLVAKKVGGAWTGPVYLKSAWADANGIVTVSMKSASAAAVNVRVQWPGNANYAVSTSKALGAYWK